MRTNNKLAKVTALMLLVVMIGLILVAGTYAKYTTTVSGSDTAVVAKFSVGANTSNETFDLFGTTVIDDDATTSDSSDVASNRIAPGTGGKFNILLTNASEVAVNYTLNIEETENTSNIPIEYSVDGSTYVTAEQLSQQANASGRLEIGSTTQQSKSVTIYWRWAFEGTSSDNYQATQTDSTDTTLGTMGTAPTIKVSASTVFTQVD